MSCDVRRVQFCNQQALQPGPVVYWMIRDQRAEDNWALEYALDQAQIHQQPVVVVMALRPDLRKHQGTRRWLDFMLTGLEELEQSLAQRQIPFSLLIGDPVAKVEQLLQELGAGLVVVDQFPLTIYQQWYQDLAQRLEIPVVEVDSHNIVPVWQASQKQEFTARTIRPKIQKLLPDFLVEFPQPASQSFPWKTVPKVITQPKWSQIKKRIKVDESIKKVDWIHPGASAAQQQLQTFISHRLETYPDHRNDPNQTAVSDLSPFLHFGQISAQRIALEVQAAANRQPKLESAADAFLEELIIRRELSDNYCRYQPAYDSFGGFPDWAQKTLNTHREDRREYLYTKHQFEQAQTHDHLWNAAQSQLVTTGKMHGYLRMYWAKKILEWTPDPETAQAIALDLNDRYHLDGRDPNGFVGVAWSIGGVHDRAWPERPVFGKIRFMNANGAKRKFDVEGYVEQWLSKKSE